MKHTKLLAIVAFLLAFLICGTFELVQAAEKTTPPNVVFLFADDQRADTIGALGNPVIKTPHLDRLVQRGTAFNHAYMQGGLQGATCVPSRAMLLSGRNLFHIDENLQRHPTWPAAFGQAGYTTFLSGKWHNGPASIPLSFQNAKQVFTGGMTNPLKAKLCDLADGQMTPRQLVEKHACAVFADEAIKFISKPHSKPFFCYVPFDAPHDPHIVPSDFQTSYDPAQIPLPKNFLPQHPFNNGEMVIRDEQLLDWPRQPVEVQAMIAEYYQYVSYLDSQIGRILDALEKSPHAANTIVVFAADSGVARGSHGLIGKQNVYEHSMRVPLIIAGPGIAIKQRTDAMVYLFDVLPTLGKMCQVSGPKTSEGQEFSATLGDPAKPARSQMIFAYRNVQRALRDNRWKFIRYPNIDREQLFDLDTDPDETRNLVEQPEHAKRVATMRANLEKELLAAGDQVPFKVDNPKPAEWTPPAKKTQ